MTRTAPSGSLLGPRYSPAWSWNTRGASRPACVGTRGTFWKPLASTTVAAWICSSAVRTEKVCPSWSMATTGVCVRTGSAAARSPSSVTTSSRVENEVGATSPRTEFIQPGVFSRKLSHRWFCQVLPTPSRSRTT